MKVIKLDRRFRQCKDHGHTVALRFPDWNLEAQKVEKIASKRLPLACPWYCDGDCDGDWAGYFGYALNSRSSSPYWITFRREADLTLVLLSADLTK